MNDFHVSKSLINKQLPPNENFIQPLTCDKFVLLLMSNTNTLL